MRKIGRTFDAKLACMYSKLGEYYDMMDYVDVIDDIKEIQREIKARRAVLGLGKWYKK